jgi:hypothetical protein
MLRESCKPKCRSTPKANLIKYYVYVHVFYDKVRNISKAVTGMSRYYTPQTHIYRKHFTNWRRRFELSV